MNTDYELEEVIRIARQAAKLVRDVYETGFTVDYKGKDDPVTRADREANELICNALSVSFPRDAIIAEESAPTNPDDLARLVAFSRVWFVDPVDGTREFTEHIEEFAVMIGLSVAGRANLGVLAMPLSGQVIAGRVGSSAFVEDSNGLRRPIYINDVKIPDDKTIIISRSHRPPFLEDLKKGFDAKQVVKCGSVGVKVIRLLFGQAHLYVHGTGTKRWDACGPEAVLLAAGGRFTDLTGTPIFYSSPDLVLRTGILAGNTILHARAVATMLELQKTAAQ